MIERRERGGCGLCGVCVFRECGVFEVDEERRVLTKLTEAKTVGLGRALETSSGVPSQSQVYSRTTNE